MTKSLIFLALSIALVAPFSHSSVRVPINNFSFENDLTGWSSSGNVTVSSIAKSGSKSIKMTGKSGKVSQITKIEKNKKYQVQSWVKGEGEIFISTSQGGSQFKSTPFNVSDWTLIKLKFWSGDATSIGFGGKLSRDGFVRFDNFKLLDLSAPKETKKE